MPGRMSGMVKSESGEEDSGAVAVEDEEVGSCLCFRPCAFSYFGSSVKVMDLEIRRMLSFLLFFLPSSPHLCDAIVFELVWLVHLIHDAISSGPTPARREWLSNLSEA